MLFYRADHANNGDGVFLGDLDVVGQATAEGTLAGPVATGKIGIDDTNALVAMIVLIL